MPTKTTHTGSLTRKKIPASEKRATEKQRTVEGVDVIQAIERDHEDLKRFIEIMKDEDSTIAQKDAAYRKFSALLKSHSVSEEKAVYAKCLSEGDMGVETHEAYVEHEVATLLMKSIEATRDKERRAAQIKVLAESVEHHIEEEEEDFLPEVKKQFDSEERAQMAEEFLRLRKASQKGATSGSAGVLEQSGIH
jgi:hemerythrin-like domain-containing protein